MNGISWEMIVSGSGPILRTLILGTLTYVGLVILLRVSGKRSLSKMNAFDFVVTVAFGSLLASAMTTTNVSLVQGLLALALLIFLQWISTFLAVRWPAFQTIIKADPTLLFFQGNFLNDPMRRERITREEILAAVRQQGFANLADVDAVVLETEGSLSVLKSQATSAHDLSQLGVKMPTSTGSASHPHND